VNDGGRSTGEVITARGQDHRVKRCTVPPNGVGLAIADGLAAASGRYVLTMVGLSASASEFVAF
jgi:hypothetical protein